MIFNLGGVMDNMLYQMLQSIATAYWIVHMVGFALSAFLSFTANVLATGLVPIAITFVIEFINSTGLVRLLLVVAVMLAGLGYLLQPFFDLSLVSLRRLIPFAILITVVFSVGPQVAATMEKARMGLANLIYAQALSTMMARPEWNTIAGRLAAGTEMPIASGDPTPGDAGMTVYDVTLNTLMVRSGEEFSVGLPAGFREEYFPQASIAEVNSGALRTQALQGAWAGLARLSLALPLTVNNVFSALISVGLGLAAGFILLTLPLSLMFSVFLPMENMAVTMLKSYLNLIVYTMVVSVLTAMGISALVAAVNTGSIIAVQGANIVCFFFNFYAWKIVRQAIEQSAFQFGDSFSASLGIGVSPEREIIQGAGQAAKTAAGVAVGVTGAALTGGASLAITGLDASGMLGEGDGKGARIAANAASALGGQMMQGTPLEGAARPLMAMASQGSQRGGGVVDSVASLSPAEAGMVGLSSSRDPFSLFYAMDRMGQRGVNTQQAQQAQEGQSGGNGSDPATSAPPPLTMAAPTPQSPWYDDLMDAHRQYGVGWTRSAASAVQATVQEYRRQGVSEDNIAAMFADQEGKPTLNSQGGRDVFGRLSPEARDLLREPQGRAGMEAMFGHALAPRVEIDQHQIADAVAQAVASGAKEGAQEIAKNLQVPDRSLGGNYGAFNNMVSTAQRYQLSGEIVHKVVMDGAQGGQLSEATRQSLEGAGLSGTQVINLEKNAQMMPSRMDAVSDRISDRVSMSGATL
jgi:hypothetical protein